MSAQVVEPRIRGFLSLTAHPKGCAMEVADQIAVAREAIPEKPGGNLLVLGSSTGYGLASRIAGAFGLGMDSLGLAYERPASGRRTASAGWYNTAAFRRAADAQGLGAIDFNGDAFSKAALDQGLEAVASELGAVDILVYSIAAPRRTDPETGETFESVLKTVGEPFEIKTVDPRSLEVGEAEIPAATDEEVQGTVAVMGGDDLRRWTTELLDAGLLNQGARVVAYSYIGPEVTWPIYRDGTIGKAKAHLEATCRDLDALLTDQVSGRCQVSINKSVVTQASAAIPGVPLYMSVVFEVMKAAGTHEGPIEQMVRLFRDHLAPAGGGPTDEAGRIRLDDLEMQPEIQAEVIRRWEAVTTANLLELTDYDGYQRYFRQLFGFERRDVDYEEPVEVEVDMPGMRSL